MKGDDLYMNKSYMETIEAKIAEAHNQLSTEAQRYINNECDGDIYMGAMSYTYEIEQRYYCNDSDEKDHNLLLNIMRLVDLLYELCDDYDDFDEDVYIEIDED